jgi:hypothetical protein
MKNYMTNRITKGTKFLILLIGTLALSLSHAGATLILKPTPDIASSLTTFSDTSALIEAHGWAFSLDSGDGSGPQSIDNGLAGMNFHLLANMNGSGGLLGGSLTITYIGGDLLLGTLTANTPAVGSGFYNFLFNVDGGDAAALYGGLGGHGGIILDSSFLMADTGVPSVPDAGGTWFLLGVAFALTALMLKRNPVLKAA